MRFDISYDNDHQFLTKPDGERRREKKSLRTFEYPIQVLESSCKPVATIVSFDDLKEWKHHQGKRLLLEGIAFSSKDPSENCGSPAAPEFCWGICPHNDSAPVNGGNVCENLNETCGSPALDLPPYSLD